MQLNDLNNLIAFIIADPALNAIVGNRVYLYGPRQPDEATYLIIQELSESREDCTLDTLMDFRFVAGDTELAPLTMKGYIQTLRDTLEQSTFDLGGSLMYQIEPLNDLFMGHDDNGRLTGVTSFSFKETR